MISCRGVGKVFGDDPEGALALARSGVSRAQILRRTGNTVAVHDVSFDILPGELFVVMGLSGSGKSTLVRMLNRLIPPTSGSISVDGQALEGLGDAELRKLRNHRMSMVFQHFALFPHRTVRENAAYGLKVRGVGAGERRERADWALATVGLGDQGEAYPAQLSGGMKQRVGLARALATDSDVLLMDEPFSALDPLIRREMQDLLLRLQGELHKTVVFITHDLNEAMRLGDRILLLKDGRVVQLGTGPEIVSAPADDYVADFVSDVDRTRVLTAADVVREPRVVARLGDRPEDVLRQLGAAESNGAYVVDHERRVVGVVRDDVLASAVRIGARTIPPDALTDDFVSARSDRPLIDLLHLVGHHVVPLAALDGEGRMVGVVPRAAVLDALSTRTRSGHAAPAAG
jgi:glycine betaine/proline transport system ATP-binding protein